MRFALLGADSESQALADAAVAAGHAIVWREETVGPDRRTSWEDLLDAEAADAVLVGAGGADSDARARQVQELAKQGRPLLTVHPVVPSVISFFEIDMARSESGAILRHFNPLLESTLIDRVATWAVAGHPELGTVEQIVATRFLGDRSRARVVWHFARDVELLARLAGRFDRIGAHAAMDDPETAYASLGVQLLGARQAPVRWSVEPPAGAPELRVALVCQYGRATLLFDADDGLVELVEQTSAGESCTPASGPRPPAAAVVQYVSAVKGEAAAASSWPSALDAMELADSIEISLRRGRMIDVHHRELTEQLAFKGVMSAVGCGILVVLVPAVMAIGWLAGILRIPLSDYWPHVLLAALGAFLALQLAAKLISRQQPPADHAEAAPAGHVASPSDVAADPPAESNSTD